LQAIWAKVLAMAAADVELHVPFTEYGGDSLLAIEVLSQAARKGLLLASAAHLSADFEVFALFA
jgi:hypothetical protein